MIRFGTAVVVAILLSTGCGVSPSEVTDGGDAPTGLAPGVTLYFVDSNGALAPRLRETGRLGTISEAVSLLLDGPGDFDLDTEIAATEVTRVRVDTEPELIRLMVPLADYEVTSSGIDQIVCTAVGAHVQAGGSPRTRVQVRFTQHTPESDVRRTCPLLAEPS
ncbi:hypothetical protein FHR81_002081 [Actinoalloteichus hoggarensis]|uniref:Uncharacterized protein n=1 Tax=Actinoalloteichus hoggarensis TaxID=1470176 RepID=A0A221W5Z5_9PSEU|nr:hypothetical protein [Actinoalloteichus hoggarensis]ASO21114.1 hypothetical protein AHOG_17445 [Actinoalloteichus hoggarensis]MBB5921043.1 hypothetical protein [Actinoalloteichus hoggarensis]